MENNFHKGTFSLNVIYIYVNNMIKSLSLTQLLLMHNEYVKTQRIYI